MRERIERAPAPLARRLEDVLSEPLGDDPVSNMRAKAGVLLDEAAVGEPGRHTAITLLAADALVTFACEYLALTAPDRLEEMGAGPPA